MKRLFLFVWADSLGDAMKVKDIVGKIPGVLAWRYDMGHAMYILSDKNADYLAQQLRPYVSPNFLVTEIYSDSDRTQGWLSTASVYLLQKKELMPEASPGDSRQLR